MGGLNDEAGNCRHNDCRHLALRLRKGDNGKSVKQSGRETGRTERQKLELRG